VSVDLPVVADDGAVLLADRWVPGGTGDRAQPTFWCVHPTAAADWSERSSDGCWPSADSRSSSRACAGRSAFGGQFSPFDERADGLATYTTPPLSGALEALGPVRVELWVRASGCAPQARRPNSRQYVAVGAVTSGSAALSGSLSSAAVIGFGA
jgi:hypothetical protein